MKNLFKAAAAAMVLVSATCGCSSENLDDMRFRGAQSALAEGDYQNAYTDLSNISDPSRFSGYAAAVQEVYDESDDAEFSAAKKAFTAGEFTMAKNDLSRIHRPSRFKYFDVLQKKIQMNVR